MTLFSLLRSQDTFYDKRLVVDKIKQDADIHHGLTPTQKQFWGRYCQTACWVLEGTTTSAGFVLLRAVLTAFHIFDTLVYCAYAPYLSVCFISAPDAGYLQALFLLFSASYGVSTAARITECSVLCTKQYKQEVRRLLGAHHLLEAHPISATPATPHRDWTQHMGPVMLYFQQQLMSDIAFPLALTAAVFLSPVPIDYVSFFYGFCCILLLIIMVVLGTFSALLSFYLGLSETRGKALQWLDAQYAEASPEV